MHNKKWTDCPVCGAKASMRTHIRVSHEFTRPGYAPIAITGLDGQFCDACGDGFWSLKSERTISQVLSEQMARQDAARVVASDLASVREAAAALRVTPQAIHKMMKTGRLRSVYAGDVRLPLRTEVQAHRRTAVR
jgi:YgiT-type zinc finger domain-containing protein